MSQSLENHDMQALFKGVLDLAGINGVVLMSFDGRIIFKHSNNSDNGLSDEWSWKKFAGALEGIKETDLIYEKCRIYIRRSDLGYLLVIMERQAPIAMLRLNCDIILPSLKPVNSPKGLKRFFKKGK